MSTFKSGYKYCPPQSGDKVFDEPVLTEMAKLVGASGGDYSIPEYTPISDQGSLNSCVANAVCDALEILLGVEDPNKVIQLSRLMTYWNARVYTNDSDKDEGTYIRHAVDSLRQLGVCPENVWPYNPSAVFAQPPIRAYQESLDNKIEDYFTIASTGTARCDAVEAAVRANHPAVFASVVTDEYTKYFNGNNRVWHETKTWVGAHAQIIVGVRFVNGERQFKVRNSWGSSWGDNGHTWYAEDYVASSLSSDFWILTRVPALVF